MPKLVRTQELFCITLIICLMVFNKGFYSSTGYKENSESNVGVIQQQTDILGLKRYSAQISNLSDHAPIVILSDEDFSKYNFTGNGTALDPIMIQNYNITTYDNYAIYDNCSYLPHDPIHIMSDSDIQNYSFPGSGTAKDPYRIEYLNITSLNETAIVIVNTTKSFIIHNCYLTTNEYYSVFIENFSMGSITIQHNIFMNRTTYTGIGITNCSNINVLGNQFEMGHITVVDSDSLIVSENTLLTGNIYLYACKNIQIISNYCANVEGEVPGIFIKNSEHIVIEKNSCTNNEIGGIGCDDSIDVSIIGNNCWKNKLYAGIGFYNVTKGEIKDNLLSDNIQVNILLLSFCKSIAIINNTLINSQKFECWYGDILGLGIWVDDQATDILIEKNECGRNLVGISIYRLEHAIVKDNFVWGSYVAGIKLYNVNNTMITYNTLFCNSYGIYCSGTTEGSYDNRAASYNNFIHHNNFIENNPNGSSQAYDAGVDTRWYDPRSYEGNYWSNWNGTGVYYIDGPAESFDPYPLDHSVVYHPISSLFDYWLFDFSLVFSSLVALTGLYFVWRLIQKRKPR